MKIKFVRRVVRQGHVEGPTWTMPFNDDVESSV